MYLLLFSFFYAFSGLPQAAGRAPWVGSSFRDAPCQGDPTGYGPYDYTERHKHRSNLHTVERYHFNQNVENLKGGAQTPSGLEGDLDYTLRAFPNHHRALYAVVRYQFIKGNKIYRSAKLSPAECYLQRAINFSPGDGMAHMIYGILLHKSGKPEKALGQYEKAEKLIPGNGQLLYNKGLLLVDMGRHDQAREIADELYRQSFPLQGLKNKLVEAGYWHNRADDQ
jgi:tetratricopeptide (TPR) repeat protein